MVSAAAAHLQPTVEDCDDSDEGVVIPSAPSPPSLPKANVHQKRSNPSVHGPDKPSPLRPMDQQSDSGYSSHTAATMSSADSAPSATSQRSPPVRPPPGPSHSPASRTARPDRPERPEHHRHSSSQSSHRLPLDRTPSHPSRRPSVTTRPSHSRRDSRVSEVRPEECAPSPQALRRPRPSHPEVVPDQQHERPMRRDSVAYRSTPPPPQYQRQYPTYHHHEAAIVQPAVSRRRPSVSGPRPTSYHGEPVHNRPRMPMHHSPQIEQHGPPPSRSAYGNQPYGHPQILSYMQHPQQQQQHYYNQPQQMQPHAAYDPHARGQYPPQPGYGRAPVPAPIVTQLPSARGPMSATHARSQFHPPPPPPPALHQPEYDDDESESDSSYSEDEQPPPPPSRRHSRTISRQPQPPPPPPPPPSSRPKPVHAKTTPAGPTSRRPKPKTVVVADPRVEKDRRGSLRAASRPPHIKSNSYDTHNARVIVESPRSNRREAPPRVYVEDRPRRMPKEYHPESRRPSRYVEETFTSDSDEGSEEEEEQVPRVLNRSRRDSRRPTEVKKEAAESYINANRGFNETYADQSYRAAKRGSRVPSEAESSRSRGSDKQSYSGGNGEIRLKVDASAPVSLFLTGDIEGRKLQLMPADEGGMAELVISGGNGTERSYISERSRDGRRAIMPASQPRRDAEEFSDKSSRSGRTRRDTHTTRDDRDRRHVLRR